MTFSRADRSALLSERSPNSRVSKTASIDTADKKFFLLPRSSICIVYCEQVADFSEVSGVSQYASCGVPVSFGARVILSLPPADVVSYVGGILDLVAPGGGISHC